MPYLIVIEAQGAAPPIYHYLPYRLAATVDEAKELMRDYMRHLDYNGLHDLVPQHFAIFKEVDGVFTGPHYFDPLTQEEIDATMWLQETERI